MALPNNSHKAPSSITGKMSLLNAVWRLPSAIALFIIFIFFSYFGTGDRRWADSKFSLMVNDEHYVKAGV